LAAKAISQQAYDLLMATQRQDAADLLAAQANVQTNALNLEFTRVVAPLGGRVSDRRIAPGNLVTADTTVLTNIVNLNPIRFAFTGSEAAYLKYQRENAAGTRTSSREAQTPVEIRLQDEATYRWRAGWISSTMRSTPARAPSAAARWWTILATSSPPACSATCGCRAPAPIWPC
jgi:multidrug efflux pump subunit AcrA (membrane-fusion protein)